MIDTVIKLHNILSFREKVASLLIFAFMFFVALIEAIGVASIMPFIAVLSNPQIIDTNKYLSWLYVWLSFQSIDSFFFFLGCFFLVLIVGSLLLRGVSFWIQIRFSFERNHLWSCRLVRDYLNKPYVWFLDKHSGSLGSTVLTEVGRLVHGILFPFIQIVSHVLIVFFLVGLLLVADPVLAFAIVLSLGFSYFFVYSFTRGRLKRYGEVSFVSNKDRYRIIQESFSGIKEIKVSGLEDITLQRYFPCSLDLSRAHVKQKMYLEVPSFFMQALVFGGFITILLYFISRKEGLQEALPVFSLYALATYRLMPSLQTIYKMFSEIRYNQPAFLSLYENMLNLSDLNYEKLEEDVGRKDISTLELGESIIVKNLSFRYPNSKPLVLDNITFKICMNEFVGFVGSTGSGKTTLADIMMGLIKPTAGSLLIGTQKLTEENIRAWQKNIGYVPQNIFLSDSSIRENIAFGIRSDQISDDAIVEVSKTAELHDFVINDLPAGYNTIVGERGVKLSGGQRQRIGIARALYHDPSVLVFDEATSALDNLTEKSIIDSLFKLKDRKTVILIAHRLTTVKKCDKIFCFQNGKISDAGSYRELMARSNYFRSFVEATESK